MGRILESSLKYCQRSVILSAALQITQKPGICLHTMHRRALDAQGAGVACHHCLAVGATIVAGRQTRHTPIVSLACHHHTRVPRARSRSGVRNMRTTTKASSSSRKQKPPHKAQLSVFHTTHSRSVIVGVCRGVTATHEQKKTISGQSHT